VAGSARGVFRYADTLPMDRDATFLFSLVTFAVAACAVGICGWIVWSRSRPANAPSELHDHPGVPEES
jgi:hypothetical protein